jgi:hypothetical protein
MSNTDKVPNNDKWTTMRVSKRFMAWLNSKGNYKSDKSSFGILIRLLGWKDDETDGGDK